MDFPSGPACASEAHRAISLLGDYFEKAGVAHEVAARTKDSTRGRGAPVATKVALNV
jgi:hypothetical protein